MDHGEHKWVALLRGVNVGGANRVPMEELRALAEGLGWRNVRSYIASGNLVFEAATPRAADLSGALRRDFGVDVAALILRGDEISSALAGCPWDVKGNLVHAFFCWTDTQVDQLLLEQIKAPDEELVFDGRIAWFHAPSGVARSKLMAKMDRVLGTQTTARNLNTVRKLAEMVR